MLFRFLNQAIFAFTLLLYFGLFNVIRVQAESGNQFEGKEFFDKKVVIGQPNLYEKKEMIIYPLAGYTPFPNDCSPRKGDAALYIFTGKKMLKVADAHPDRGFDGYFDVAGVFLFDNDNDVRGRPEAYGYGEQRSSAGGSIPQNYWWYKGEWKDLSKGMYAKNFGQGVLLAGDDAGGHLSLVINLSDWVCHVSHNKDGNLAVQ